MSDRILTADDILSADDHKIERVEVPEWGGVIFVRGMTGEERDAFEESMLEQRGSGRNARREVRMRNIRAGLVARTACNESGTRIFADSQVAALGKKSAAALDRVYEVAARLSGLRQEDVEELVDSFPETSE